MKKSTAALGSAVFFLAAPCVAFLLIPWLISGWYMTELPVWWWFFRAVGIMLILVGTIGLVHSFYRFVTEGRGTPAPPAPPEELVIGGPYRFVRNPMYVAGLAAILGQALFFGNLWLALYALVLWAFVAAFVTGYEEPKLKSLFGQRYLEYRRAVPGWIPRLTPWAGE